MTKRERFLIHAMRFHGLPYIWGGDNPKVGLDCSGLVQHLLAYLSLDPPGDQTADGLMRILGKDGKEVSAGDADLGDIVFYGSGKATHVTLALGEGLMIEAGGGGSKTTSVEIARRQGAQTMVTPIARRRDLIKIIRPAGLKWS